MTRPTKEELAEAVVVLSDAITNPLQRAAWDTIAAEVSALSEALTKMTVYAQRLEDNHGELETAEGSVSELRALHGDLQVLRGQRARVEALPVKWRDDMRHHQESVSECVRELEQALRGEP